MELKRGSTAAAAYRSRHGLAPSTETWEQLPSTPGYHDVAVDVVEVGGRFAHVDTFWVGVTPGGALPFRTAIPRAAGPPLFWGWATEAEAKAGHEAVCAWLAGRGPMPSHLVGHTP